MGIRRSTGVLLLGSGTGHAVGLIFTILVARLFSPDVYGAYASVLALASAFIGASTLRLEIRAHAEDPETAIVMLGTALWVVVASSTTIALWSAVYVFVLGGSMYWLWTSPLVFVGSLQPVRTAQLVRRGDYRKLATANFLRGSSMGVSQYLLGLIHAAIGFLSLGFVLSRLVWLPALRMLNKVRLATAFAVVRENWSYCLYAGLSALSNSLGGQFPILVAALLYGNVEAGLFAMMTRLLMSPLSVVGQAVAAASLGHIGSRIRESDPSALKMMRHTTRDLLLVGLVPCGLIALIGPRLADRFLGAEWTGVGDLLVVMSIGALAQFVASPFAQMLNVTDRSFVLLGWDIARLAIVGGAMVIPAVAGAEFITAALFLSVGYVVTYGALFVLVHRAIRSAVGA